MCVTDRHDVTLAVKVALNTYTINQPTTIFKPDPIILATTNLSSVN